VAKNLPLEDKLLGIKESEVVLALPFAVEDCKIVPKVQAQDIYAFLPIRRGGLPVCNRTLYTVRPGTNSPSSSCCMPISSSPQVAKMLLTFAKTNGTKA
jgi:hypothetical protein